MYGPTTHYNNKTNVKCFSCLPLALIYVLSLNRHWSIIWSTTVCWMFDHSSFRHCLSYQHLALNFNRPAPVVLWRFCNLCTEIWSGGKSQVGRYLVSCEKAAWCLCVHSALARC